MKKYIYILVSILILGIGFLFINDFTYSPLKDSDFKKLFSDYNNNANKKCSIDFLGWSSEGAVFDLYVYEIKKGSVDTTYPNFKNGWKNINDLDDVVFSKWKKCPMDSLSSSRYNFTLTTEDFSKKECSQSFNNELNNPNSYYSYVYVSELEQYFFMYSPNKERLYYVRRRGF